MKGVLFPMPESAEELAMYFDNVDKLFDNHYVDEDLRIALLNPNLTRRARQAILAQVPAPK
jgi:hypothetical protein